MTGDSAAEVSRIVAVVRAAETFGQARELLAETLGLQQNVTPEATARFLSDDAFANTLVGSRFVEDWRDRMLADPLNAYFTAPAAPDGAPDLRSASAVGEIARKAANAYIQWGKDGFQPVDAETLARRRSACLSCDQLREAPETLVYTLAAKLADGDRRICAACGCLFQKKTEMPSETCPLRSTETPDRSRWGEAFRNRK